MEIACLNKKNYELIFSLENNRWHCKRNCPECKKELKYEATEKYYLIRNLKNANIKNSLCNTCCRLGNKNGFFNKKHKKETKQQISKNRIGKACRERNSMANPENRQKVSKGLREGYDSGKLNYVREINRNTMKNNIANGKIKFTPISKAEKEIFNSLKEKYPKIISQFLLESFPFDFYIPEKNLLIEYNGDYWHCNPKKYTADYLNKNKNMTAQELWKQDERKKNLATEKGYNFLVIWENDYNKNKKVTIEKI